MHSRIARRATFDVAVAFDPDYASAHFGRYESLRAINENETALEAINAAWRIKPKRSRYLVERAAVLRDLDRPFQTLKDTDAALVISPNYRWAKVVKSWALFETGRSLDAVNYAEQEAKAEPDSNYLWYNLADIASEDAQFEKALMVVNKSLELEGADEEDKVLKAYSLFELEQYEDALKLPRLQEMPTTQTVMPAITQLWRHCI